MSQVEFFLKYSSISSDTYFSSITRTRFKKKLSMVFLILVKPMPKGRLYPTCNLFCLFLSSPLTRRHNEQDGQVSWCLTDLTTVQNPHAHIANHETH
jgi:hypothetical protein